MKDKKRGPTAYLVWTLLECIASKMPKRGVLADENGPLDFSDFELMTDVPAKLFKDSVNVLIEIGWLEIFGSVPNDSERFGKTRKDSAYSTGQDSTVQYRTEQEKVGVAAKAAPPDSPPVPTDLWGTRGDIRYDKRAKQFTGITAEHMARWQESYPLVNVAEFLARMASKVWANRTGWGRKSDYERALENWLSKEQDSARASGKKPVEDVYKITKDATDPDVAALLAEGAAELEQ